MGVYTKEDLIQLKPEHDSFVGIDSDGCVFDTMTVKQCDFFHPLIIRIWGLEKIGKQVRAAAEFVNLHSKWRGKNRFLDLLKSFELLHEWPEAAQSGVVLPDLEPIRAYCGSGLPLGNPTLADEVRRTGNPELERMLEWSETINREIHEHMPEIPPFKGVREALEKIRQHSDAIVVSQTPEAALVKEWEQHDLEQYIKVIAGQELGTKAEHLQLAAGGKYPMHKVLLLGDAPGDCAAAEETGSCFYPIMPGKEEESWAQFADEAYELFLAGKYQGKYEDSLKKEFMALLPGTPPWNR